MTCSGISEMSSVYSTHIINERCLEGVTPWECNCLANHWNYYPEPACFTVNSVKQAGGSDSILLSWEPVITSPVIPNKDGRATDSCFVLVVAHHCGVQMVCWDDWLPMYLQPLQTLVVSNKGRHGGYSLWTGTID